MEIYKVNGVFGWQNRLQESNQFLMHEANAKSKIWIFLDENLASLHSALKDMGFRLFPIAKGTKDDEIKELIEQIIIVTRNSKDFIDDAIIYDYDVVGVEGIKFIDSEPTKKNLTAKKIASAIITSQISKLVGNFYMEIKDDGKWIMHDLRK
jgi:hypothetical protein